CSPLAERPPSGGVQRHHPRNRPDREGVLETSRARLPVPSAPVLIPLSVRPSRKVLMHSPPPSAKIGPAVSPLPNQHPGAPERDPGSAGPGTRFAAEFDPCPSTSSVPTAAVSAWWTSNTSAPR